MVIHTIRPKGNKSGSGSKLLNQFLGVLAKAISKRIDRSAIHSFFERDDPEMPFWYNEQTTKGIITASIDEVTKTNFFQEYSVDRNERKGRIDYWLEYGDKTKVQIFLEVKQGWARIYDNEITVYANSVKLFNDAIGQLSAIKDKSSYGNFAVGMLIMPAYSKYESCNDNPIELNNDRIKRLSNSIKDKFKQIYEIDIIKTSRKFNLVHEFPKQDNTPTFESHPGICLVYYVRKITRK